MKLKKWTGLLLLMLVFCFANINTAKAQETTSQTVDQQKYSANLAESSYVKKISETYENPMYKGQTLPKANTSSVKNVPALAGTSGQTFSSISDAASYLRDAMVNRQSEITFTINKSYYSSLAHDIFNAAVAESNASGSSEGDYLYAHFSGYNLSGYTTSGQTTLIYQMEYLSTYAQEQAVDSAVNSVLSSLNVYSSDDYTKIKAVHDYIVQNIKYDYSLSKYSAYNAIVEKDVVCQGFASLTYKMLKKLNVGVRFIGGVGNGGSHAWNIVRISGKWYNIDNTWDENYTDYYSSISYAYFLKNNNDFGDHVRDSEYNDSSFNSQYPMSTTSYAGGSTDVSTGTLVSSITLNKTNLSLTVGQTGSLAATVLPSNADDTAVTWTSSNTSVATVDSNGNVTAVAAGTATITCQANDGSGIASTCAVTVTEQKIKVTAVVLNQRNLALTIGKAASITATILPTNATSKEVIWTSSNASVATVDANGNVTAVGAGTAVITCTANDGSGKFAICLVKVTDGTVKVSSIILNQRNLNLTIGKTSNLVARVLPSNATNPAVTWASSNTSVATVDASGNVTAIGAGTAVITCTANDGSGKTAICLVKVTDGTVKVSRITLNQRNLNLIIGKTSNLVAKVSPNNATNTAVTWTSSDESVATVDANGTVTAVGVGTTKITCTASDGSGKTATVTIKVTDGRIKVKSISLNKRILSVTAGSTSTLIARISPSNATNKEVTWTSSDEGIATVDENGNVTAVSAGIALITCEANDGSGKYSTCLIRVK